MRLVVVGGGVSGLTFALLAARAGHEIVVLDRDPPRDGGIESAWEHWERRSVPQFRQIHGFQAAAHALLRHRLPDVLSSLHRAGARDASRIGTTPGGESVRGSEDLVQFQCRRSTLEWVLRQAAASERGVVLRDGVEANGLIANESTSSVRGVRTTHGDILADLVVDASGRRSQCAAWCAEAGFPASTRSSVDTGQVYFTRWFRSLDPAHEVPATRIELSFATLIIYPGDAGWFSVTFFAPAADSGLRAMLLDPDRLVTAACAVPVVAELLSPDLVRPHGDVLFMGRLTNQLRRTPVEGPVAPVVSLADALMCSNPTWGRGVALAFSTAASLADVLGELEDPVAVSRQFARTSVAQLEPWYHDTVRLDAEVNSLWSQASPPATALVNALAAAAVDPVVSIAYSRYRNLLDPPAAFWENEHIADRVRDAIAHGAPTVMVATPSRADLDSL